MPVEQKIAVAVIHGDGDGIVRQSLLPVQSVDHVRQGNRLEMPDEVGADGFDIGAILLAERMEHQYSEFTAMPAAEDRQSAHPV